MIIVYLFGGMVVFGACCLGWKVLEWLSLVGLGAYMTVRAARGQLYER